MLEENPSNRPRKLRSSSKHRRSCWRSLGFKGNGVHEKDRMLKRDDQMNKLQFATCVDCVLVYPRPCNVDDALSCETAGVGIY